MDKVQKIREEVERIQLYTQSEVLKQVLDYIDEVQKEPVNEEFEKTFISMVNATHENNGSYSLHDFAQRLYNIAKEELEEPVSEDFEEAADNALSKVLNTHEIVNIRSCLEMFRLGAKWQEDKDKQTLNEEGVVVLPKEESVSKDLEQACDSYYEETWDEHGGKAMVVDGCHDVWFPSHATDDFFKAGAKWKEEQMMAKAIDAEVKVDAGGYPYIPQIEIWDYDKDEPLAEEGNKVKVIVIKEE